MRNLLFIFIISFFSFVLPSYAQDSSVWIPRTPEKKEYSPNKIFKDLPPEIQEDLLEEAETVYKKCQEIAAPGDQLLDCGCISIKFLDKRILDGPDVPREYLVQSLDTKECKSIENIAARLYSFCTQSYYWMSGYEDMCQCAANKGSKNLMKYDIVTPKAVGVQLVQGLQECDENWLMNGFTGKKNKTQNPYQAP